MPFVSRAKPFRRNASSERRLVAPNLRRRVARKARLGTASLLSGVFLLTAPLWANDAPPKNAAACANPVNDANNPNAVACANPVNDANRPNAAACANPVNDANNPNAVACANPVNDANRPNAAACVNDVNNALFPNRATFARPAVLCELAGIPVASSNWGGCVNWASFSSPASTLQPPPTRSYFAFQPLPTSQTAPLNATLQAFQTPRFPQTALIPSVAPIFPIAPSVPNTPTPSIPPTVPSAPIVRGGYLSSLPIEPFRGRAFAYADASWGKQAEQSDDPFASGFNVASFGGGVGQDWRLTKNAIWGAGIQGRNIQLDPAKSIYESEIDSLAGFLRLSLFGPLWRLDLSIGAAQNWNEQSFGAKDVTKYSSTQWNYEAEFGVRFDKGYTRVEPLVSVRVLTLSEPAEAERRLVAFGRPDDYADASYRLKLGSRFSWEYATHLATLKPYLSATWAHEFGDRALYTVGENSPFPIAYRFARHKMARDRLDLGGGVDAALRDTVDVFFRYDVEFAKEYTNYLFYAGFHKKF